MGTDWLTTFSDIGSSTGIFLFAFGLWKGGTEYYRRTLGSRRDITKRFNKLACGVTDQYVHELFGAPIFQRDLGSELGFIERIYWTPHAWLVLWFSEQNSVQLISITVTDPCFQFKTAWLTIDQLKVTLGQSRFSHVTRDASGHSLRIAARKGEYAESYYFGNPGHYAFYILSYNMDGPGVIAADAAVSEGITLWQDGDFRSKDAPTSLVPSVRPNLEALRAGTTINTITIGAPLLHPTDMARDWIGVDHDTVRGLRTWQSQRGGCCRHAVDSEP